MTKEKDLSVASDVTLMCNVLCYNFNVLVTQRRYTKHNTADREGGEGRIPPSWIFIMVEKHQMLSKSKEILSNGLVL